jgi:hypothetical protein
MKFKESFIKEIEQYNGQIVELAIVQIDGSNHPLGQLGVMMMGEEQTNRVNKAINFYGGENNVVIIKAFMEIVNNDGGEKLVFLNDNFELNCIEIFRPNPPMIIEGNDMSLWWSYHPYTVHEQNQLSIIKNKGEISESNLEGDCHTIRDIFINGKSHCL